MRDGHVGGSGAIDSCARSWWCSARYRSAKASIAGPGQAGRDRSGSDAGGGGASSRTGVVASANSTGPESPAHTRKSALRSGVSQTSPGYATSVLPRSHDAGSRVMSRRWRRSRSCRLWSPRMLPGAGGCLWPCQRPRRLRGTSRPIRSSAPGSGPGASSTSGPWVRSRKSRIPRHARWTWPDHDVWGFKVQGSASPWEPRPWSCPCSPAVVLPIPTADANPTARQRT